MLPFPLLQLVLDTLVAAVLTLLVLPLLYRVKALVLVPALLMELRQLLDAVELALEARGRPLLVLAGDAPRGPLPPLEDPKGELPEFAAAETAEEPHICGGDGGDLTRRPRWAQLAVSCC